MSVIKILGCLFIAWFLSPVQFPLCAQRVDAYAQVAVVRFNGMKLASLDAPINVAGRASPNRRGLIRGKHQHRRLA
jgi:hypothetical protein